MIVQKVLILKASTSDELEEKVNHRISKNYIDTCTSVTIDVKFYTNVNTENTHYFEPMTEVWIATLTF